MAICIEPKPLKAIPVKANSPPLIPQNPFLFIVIFLTPIRIIFNTFANYLQLTPLKTIDFLRIEVNKQSKIFLP
jgi:hypothetical protein